MEMKNEDHPKKEEKKVDEELRKAAEEEKLAKKKIVELRLSTEPTKREDEELVEELGLACKMGSEMEICASCDHAWGFATLMMGIAKEMLETSLETQAEHEKLFPRKKEGKAGKKSFGP
jgi:hypothetical protein